MSGNANAARWTSGRFLGPVAVLVAGAALSVALFAFVRDDLRHDARLRFDRQAADAKHIIDRRLQSYIGVTYGLKALFAARDSVDRAEFHGFVDSLNLGKDYHGIMQLNFARHVRPAEKERFEQEVRNDRTLDARGYPGFAIRPPGSRAAYHVIVYVEPWEGNEFAFGIDVIAAAPQAAAVSRQRDRGEIVSSGRLLNVGKDGSVGLAMRLAVYRKGARLDTVEARRAAFTGTVGAGFNVRKVMAGVLDETTMTSMRYRLYDAGPVAGGEKVPRSLLFDSAQTAPGTPLDDFRLLGDAPRFDAVVPLEFAGRSWELHFSAPQRAFLEHSDAELPWIALAGGLLCSLLLFAVLHSFASSRERAVTLAAEITRELRESEASLANAQSLARLGSWTLDLAARTMTWSAETFRLLRLDAARTTPGLDAFLYALRPADRDAFLEAAQRCAKSGVPSTLELALHFGEQTQWAHFILEPLAGALRGTIMDVTERRSAMELQRASAVKIRDLLRRLVSVQEAERRRFSANLHDLVGQSLSVLGMGLETIRSLLPGGAAKKAEATFDDMGQLLKDTMGSVRAVMSDLRPPLLDDYGLYAALEWHAAQLQSRTGVRVVLEGGKLEPRPSAEVEMALFRIAQEALTNVAKHAAASRVTIALAADAGRVRLVVEDDGCGIAARRAANDPASAGWGMAVMRERAVAAGGTMQVESAGRGTRIVVELAS